MSPAACWVASPVGAILQGELLSNIVEVRVKLETIGTADLEVEEFVHPLGIVLTQDCDLDWDYKARTQGGAPHRLIENVLCCEVDDAAEMRERGDLKSRAWDVVKINQNERYHVLPPVPDGTSQLAAHFRQILGLDFRRFFTAPTAELYKRLEIGEAIRQCFLEPTYRDHLSHRFYGYHMRVALPGGEE